MDEATFEANLAAMSGGGAPALISVAEGKQAPTLDELHKAIEDGRAQALAPINLEITHLTTLRDTTQRILANVTASFNADKAKFDAGDDSVQLIWRLAGGQKAMSLLRTTVKAFNSILDSLKTIKDNTNKAFDDMKAKIKAMYTSSGLPDDNTLHLDYYYTEDEPIIWPTGV